MPLFSIPAAVRAPGAPEFAENLLQGPEGMLLERIVSWGHITPEGEWYDQEKDEWVAVLHGSATIAYEDGTSIELQAGEHLLLPARRKHRVARSSTPCVWLALHGTGLRETEIG